MGTAWGVLSQRTSDHSVCRLAAHRLDGRRGDLATLVRAGARMILVKDGARPGRIR